MRLVRIGVGAVSVKVGDFVGNVARLRAVIGEAKAQGVHLLVTPELALSGYSLEDRIGWPDISRRSWEGLLALAETCDSIDVFVGLPVRDGALVYNAMALLHGGKIQGLVLKRFLPTYGVFYEGRNWTPWAGGVTELNGSPAGDLVFRLPYGCVSAEICEDLWSASSPAHARVAAGAEIICNGSASPFTPRKNEQRRRLVLGAAGNLVCVYAYANILGCDNSRLVFDGGGFVATPEGIVTEGPILSTRYWTLASGIVDLDQVTRARAENSTWRQEATGDSARGQTKVLDLARQEADATGRCACNCGGYTQAPIARYAEQMPKSFFMPEVADPKTTEPLPTFQRDVYLDELFDALVLGLRDYFEKVGAFRRFLVAVSGGRDSSLCLLIAVHAAKALKEGTEVDRYPDRVWTAYLPNRAFSSRATEEAARSLTAEIGVPFQVVSIAEEVKVALAKAEELIGGADKVTALAKQNLQARVRGNMALNWANSAGGLLLVTSNLSEAAVGYTTTGGDNQGGYAPIANLPKTLVSRLVEYIAHRDGIRSMDTVLAIPPSAELAPDQKDESDLMPYVILDDLLFLFARRRMSLSDCWRMMCQRHPEHEREQLRTWTATFGRLFAASQWKREQLPVALKVLDLDLDPKTGFRFPVTQSIQDELDELGGSNS